MKVRATSTVSSLSDHLCLWTPELDVGLILEWLKLFQLLVGQDIKEDNHLEYGGGCKVKKKWVACVQVDICFVCVCKRRHSLSVVTKFLKPYIYRDKNKRNIIVAKGDKTRFFLVKAMSISSSPTYWGEHLNAFYVVYVVCVFLCQSVAVCGTLWQSVAVCDLRKPKLTFV